MKRRRPKPKTLTLTETNRNVLRLAMAMAYRSLSVTDRHDLFVRARGIIESLAVSA